MKKKSIATCATGAGISLACCFGLLGFLLGLFGLTTAISYVNAYGDFIFFPSFAIFAILLIYGILEWRKQWYTYLLSASLIGFLIYFMIFGIVYVMLILGGVGAGLLLIKYILRGKK